MELDTERRGTPLVADSSGLAISRVPAISSLKIMLTTHRTTKANTLNNPTNHNPSDLLLTFPLLTLIALKKRITPYRRCF
jgi:hypothetical protein